MQTCCGCLKLKAGSYLAGGYSLILSALGVLGCVLMITVYLPSMTVPVDLEELEKEYPYYTRKELEKLADKAVDGAVDIYKITLGIAVFLYVLWFLFSILLLVGVAKSNRGCLLAWFIYTIIFSVIHGLGIVNSLVHAKTTFSTGSGASTFVVQVLVFVINMYALWCVRSHRDELLEAADNQTNEQDANPNSYRYVPNKV